MNAILLRIKSALRQLSSVRAQVVLTMISKGGAAGLGALAAALIGSVGGAKILGYYALARVIPAIFVLLTELGISNSYPYLVKRRGHSAQTVYSSGIFSAMVIAFLQLLAWFFLSDLIRVNFFADLHYRDVLLIGILAPFQVLLLHATNLQRSIGKIKGANLVFVALELLIVLFALLLVVLDEFNIAHLVVGVVIAHAVVAVAAAWSLSIIGFRFRPLFNRELLSESLRYGIRAQVGNAFQVLNYRLDQLIVGGLLGAEALGPYVIASKAAELFKFFGTSIVFVMEPILAGDSVERAALLVRKNARRVLLVNGAIVGVGVLTVPLVMPIFFGEWATAAAWPFLIISVGMLVSGANGLFGAYNFAIGRPELNTRVIAVGLAVTVSANILLVPWLGVIGAAIAAALMQIVVTVGFRLQFRQHSMQSSRAKI